MSGVGCVLCIYDCCPRGVAGVSLGLCLVLVVILISRCKNIE